MNSSKKNEFLNFKGLFAYMALAGTEILLVVHRIYCTVRINLSRAIALLAME
jgi:hypothetical protein